MFMQLIFIIRYALCVRYGPQDDQLMSMASAIEDHLNKHTFFTHTKSSFVKEMLMSDERSSLADFFVSAYTN